MILNSIEFLIDPDPGMMILVGEIIKWISLNTLWNIDIYNLVMFWIFIFYFIFIFIVFRDWLTVI